MYTEFILIFAGLGIIIVLLLVVVIFLIVLMKKSSNDLPSGAFLTAQMPSIPNSSSSAPSFQQANPYQQVSPVSGQPSQSSSVVFCKNCYTQFDASVQFCPKCGSPRI